MRKLILPALALFLVAGVASADENSDMHVQISRPALQESVSAYGEWHDGDGDHRTASSTMRIERHDEHSSEMRHASSSPMMRAKHEMRGAVPGTITSVGASSFTMTVPAGKDHATTTLTVNITSATVFSKGESDDERMGSSSASTTLGSLLVGSHVVVLGKVSTSTRSVAASRVIVTGAFRKGDNDEHEGKGSLGGIISRLKELFGTHASSTVDVQSSSTSAAAVQGGLLKSILHALFGWM